MKITLRGVRGSIPTFNPATQRYGGHTSCIEIDQDDWLLILDAGSGITNLNFIGQRRYRRIDILLTHLHMDHIQGLVFYQPLYDTDVDVHIWGPSNPTQSLLSRLGRYFSPPFSPVYFKEVNCQLHVHEIGNSTFTMGPYQIESRYVIHPGPTVGYRVMAAGKIFTYIPDHEPALGRGRMSHSKRWLSGSDLAKEADILLHDGQYTLQEYQTKKGWGHSAMEDALEFGAIHDVGKMILMHHDPMHTDAQLDHIYRHLQSTVAHDFPYELAVEGTVLYL